MKLRHSLQLDIEPGKDLAALAIVCATAVVLMVGTIILTVLWLSQPIVPQVPAPVTARHGVDQAQQGAGAGTSAGQARLQELTVADGHG